MQPKHLAFAAAILACGSHSAQAQGFLTKGLMKLAKVVGKATTKGTADLGEVVPTINFGSNVHSDKLGSIDQAMFNGWKTGGDIVSIMFTHKNTLAFSELDGTITVNGKPMPYLGIGNYGAVTDADKSPRKIEIKTSSGQKAAFTLEPSAKAIKLVAINGKRDGEINLDLSKDVELELAVPAGLEGTLFKVTLALNQLGIKSQYDACYAHAAPKVIVPASAFRNLSVAPAAKALYSFKDSYLSIAVESLESAKDVSGAFPSLKYTAIYYDGKFVNVATEPALNTGLVAKATDKPLDMQYDFFKPNAYMSRPFEQLKTIGLKSFSIRGTTYSQSSSTSTTETSTTITTTTTTTTLRFPMQPDSVWDALLEQLYPDFAAVLGSEFGATVLPVEKVTGTEAYKTVTAFSKDDQNTKVNFARAFRDTKVASAFMPLSEGYGSNGVNARLLEESGADGLLTMTLDLEISTDGKLVLMVPKFAFEILGKTHGPISETKFCSGTIQSNTGVSFKEDIKMDGLVKIIRKSDMLAVFRKGLQELKAKEAANGDYAPVWNFQFPQVAAAGVGAR